MQVLFVVDSSRVQTAPTTELAYSLLSRDKSYAHNIYHVYSALQLHPTATKQSTADSKAYVLAAQ